MMLSLSVLNTSLQNWYNMAVAYTPKKKEFLSGSSSWTDVRDVTEAHVRALKKDAAGGECITVNSGMCLSVSCLSTMLILSS